MKVVRFKHIRIHTQLAILKLIQRIDLPEDFYMLFLAAIIGIMAGFGAYILNLLISGFHLTFFTKVLAFNPFPGSSSLFRILFPAIGGLIVGLVIHFFSRESQGHGVPAVIEAIANHDGYIRPRVTLITSFTASATIGTGGSAGKEGPIVQIGAAIGSTIGQLFNVSSDRMKILVGTGAGAGLAAVFNAPVTGVLFALEVLLADFSVSAFTPIIFATVISTTISHYLIGSSPVLHVPIYYLESVYEYPLYLIMGIAGGIISVLFTKILYFIEDLFSKNTRLPKYLKPALGGLFVGLIALLFPELYGFDDQAIHNALLERTAIGTLFLLTVLKIVATSFSLGSGGSGGLFIPSLFIGATFGAFFGSVMNHFFPAITGTPGAYALVGMGIMIAGTTHATISALMLIFETTNNYQIILPLMLGTIIATLTSRLIMRENIYTMKIALSGEYIFKGRNMTLLQSIPIHQHIQKKFDSLTEDLSFKKILDLLRHSNHATFPVLSLQKKLVGIVSLHNIRSYMFDSELYPLLIAKDIMQEEFITVHPEQSLAEVLRLFDLTDAELIPVIDKKQKNHLLGVIYRDDLMRWYRKAPLLQPIKSN
jgi:chloride channel protein, CIC family